MQQKSKRPAGRQSTDHHLNLQPFWAANESDGVDSPINQREMPECFPRIKSICAYLTAYHLNWSPDLFLVLDIVPEVDICIKGAGYNPPQASAIHSSSNISGVSSPQISEIPLEQLAREDAPWPSDHHATASIPRDVESLPRVWQIITSGTLKARLYLGEMLSEAVVCLLHMWDHITPSNATRLNGSNVLLDNR
ncbi:hypothetical protein LZ32DRAFT_462382 [Colletotrichum eremochloae]|nr:hypothetical protein LZ32DRAFT_462382 [Colletotrichum eremochloae]